MIEQEVLNYINKHGEARAVDILCYINEKNTFSISRTGLAVTLSEMHRKGVIRKDRWGVYTPQLTKINPVVFAGTVSQLKVNYDELAEIVCSVFNVTQGELTSTRRHRHLVDARKAFFYFALQLRDRQKRQDSLVSIGRMLGKDHATVIHSVKQANSLIETDEEFRNKVSRIDDKVNRHSFKMESVYQDDRTIGFFYSKPRELSKHCDLVQ